MRVVLQALQWSWNADAFEHGLGVPPAFACSGRGLVHAQQFFQLPTDPLHRIQRGHGLLKNHRHAPAAHGGHCRGTSTCELSAFKLHLPLRDLARGLRQQTHQR